MWTLLLIVGLVVILVGLAAGAGIKYSVGAAAVVGATTAVVGTLWPVSRGHRSAPRTIRGGAEAGAEAGAASTESEEFTDAAEEFQDEEVTDQDGEACKLVGDTLQLLNDVVEELGKSVAELKVAEDEQARVDSALTSTV